MGCSFRQFTREAGQFLLELVDLRNQMGILAEQFLVDAFNILGFFDFLVDSKLSSCSFLLLTHFDDDAVDFFIDD